MTRTCGGCGLLFEREPGYWVGAMTMNTTAVVGIFLATFALGAVLWWPDVPWGWLLTVTIGINLIFPLIFYPYAKTIWVALDLSFRKATGDD